MNRVCQSAEYRAGFEHAEQQSEQPVQPAQHCHFQHFVQQAGEAESYKIDSYRKDCENNNLRCIGVKLKAFREPLRSDNREFESAVRAGYYSDQAYQLVHEAFYVACDCRCGNRGYEYQVKE